MHVAIILQIMYVFSQLEEIVCVNIFSGDPYKIVLQLN